ncbi:predicted protein [Nematostella vectensis]|uniref:Uncharacterized protein n=1 Tax=Nematostella vectensis TaxID=45351 RepID=A7RXG5_NEMVE|nr:predicted protein [Nematostella vectensis]|eukprot:XP_001635834.1 predicted protein [Nematostella vectensis]
MGVLTAIYMLFWHLYFQGLFSTVTYIETLIKAPDLETQKLFLAHLTPNNPLHFNCGDYETWGKTNYLKINLDREKSIWYQKAFGRDFPIVEKTLSLATNQFPSEFGSRHFMCRGRTRDGMDIFHQHLIVVPDGPRKASWLTPIENMKTNPSSVIPQVVVIQRFDPTYDGGFPVWSEPAVVKAVGNTASLAVFVLGIPYYPMIIHNCLVENRLSDWHLTHLGTVARNDTQACARLALSRGYEYMIILAETECMSSWYMPLATSAHRLRDEGQCRLEPRAYFIQATFEEYNIAWYKRIEDDKYPWKRLFSYPIRPRDKSSSHIFSVAANGHILQERVRPFSYGGHFQTFDKALFGDTYTGSHVMDIRDITVEDLGAYKFEVTVPSRGVRNEAIILLQHEGGPSIDLPERYSACEAVPGPLTVKPVEDNLLEPEELQVQAWYFSFLIGEELQRWTTTDDISFKWEGRWRETFVWTHPLPIDNGKFIEVFVKNHYGMASALAQIEVAPVDETPYPEWVTPSPFQAIDGFSQLLEVKLRSDKQLESVTWFHDDKPIEVATDRYAFPGSTAGIRTKLKLVTIDEKTPGNYKVVITGKYCQFERSIHVKVIVVPRVTFLPRADFVVAKVNDKEVIFNATVKGGNPKPKMQEMTWRKGENKMIASYSGRIVLFTTLNEQSNWFSVLKISKLRATDTAQYTFEINSGPAITKKTWQLSVRETGAVNTTYFPAGERPSKIADHSFSSPKPTSSYNTIILPFTILILLILN